MLAGLLLAAALTNACSADAVHPGGDAADGFMTEVSDSQNDAGTSDWTAETDDDILPDLVDTAIFDAVPDTGDEATVDEFVEIADLVEPEQTVFFDMAEDLTEVYLPPCDPDLPCDDENPCTVGDQCTDAGCLGIPKDCSDALDCTFDLCDGGTCSNEMKPGWCHIAGLCVEEGEQNPNNPCLECISSYKLYTWSPDDTNNCDDGNTCTGIDKCDNGSCVGETIGCDDDNPCTEDICSQGECQYLPMDFVACDDANLCTIGDMCMDGSCQAGEKLRECDDFNQCTEDSCDPIDGCIYTPVDIPCEDGNLCTKGDMCKSALCLPGEPVVCDDDNECTTDSCSPLVGCKFINNSFPCDDNDPCSDGDQCFGGLCKKGPDLVECDDQNSCTKEWCAPFVGCQYEPLDAQCSDGNGCTFGDHCENGECVFQWEMDCADDNPCTDDLCDPAFGCANVFNSNECDDGNACTLGDQCVKGKCSKGLLKLECFVENPCASGICDPALGCVMTPEDGVPCDDGDVCTVDDYCENGECHPGAADVIDCDDGNVCTNDWCDQALGCLHENIEALCDDLNLCTESDSCVDGQCFGTPVNCDDGNQCTIDTCDKWQGCQYSVIISGYCQPQIIIDYPPRAAELVSPPSTVPVSGHVVHNAAPVAWVNINGTDIAVAQNDTFSYDMPAAQGLNIIEAEVFDLFDGHDKVVQTFLMSTGYTPMNAANPSVSMIEDVVMIFLGQNVWDDNNPDPNDFATFFTYFFNSINIGSMIPNPLYENGSYKIKTSNVSYGSFSLDITCINGGLKLVATLPNLHIHIKAKSKKWYLPGASGDVDVKALVVSMKVMLSVNGAGKVKADLQSIKVDVQGLDVDLDGVLGFLFNWLINFFEGTLANMLEDQVEDAVKDALPAALEGALEDLAFDTKFDVPPLFGDAKPVSLSMKSTVSSISFSPIGGVVGLKAAVVTPKGVAFNSKGSIHRGGCLEQENPFAFWMLDEIEMGIFDDFMNQIPYAMWWAGLLTIPLDPETLGGGSFEEYGIEDLSLVATALLPPVITDCSSNQLHLQMGDLEIDASMVMWGMPVDVTMYATFTASITIEVETVNGQNLLQMGVTKINTVKLEVATVSENLVGSEDTLRLLIKQQVLPVFLEQITESALASFPLPEMDMSGMIPGAPPEVKLEMTPMSQYREKGYTVITGSVHE